MHSLYPTGSLSFVHQRKLRRLSFKLNTLRSSPANVTVDASCSPQLHFCAVFRCCRLKSPSPSTKREREQDFISFFFFLSFHFKLGTSSPARTQFQPRRLSESQVKRTLCSFSELIDKTPSHVFIPATECPL